MKKIENVNYGLTNNPDQVLDVFLPDSDSFPVFVFFHGGGIEAGDKRSYPFIEELPAKGVALVTANYRMYPSASYPDFIEDAAAVVNWVYKNIDKYGNITGIYVGGASAGAYLTQMICFDKKYLAAYGIDPDSINGYIMAAAQPTTHFNVLRERGIDSRRIIVDEAAPLYHICADRNYPPMQIIVSDNDIPNRYEQTLLLVSTLKQFGYEEKVELVYMENSSHCSYTRTADSNGNNIFAEMVCEFIAKNKGMLI